MDDTLDSRVGKLEEWQGRAHYYLFGDESTATPGLVQRSRHWDETSHQLDRIVASAKWLAATFGVFGLGLLLNFLRYFVN